VSGPGWPLRRDDGLPVLMGVVNVTPDSFSDGGEWFEPSAAIAHGLELVEQGADLVDVGGESTRPGAERPSVQEELRRVLPVVEALAGHGVAVSVDTMRAEVADQALRAGAAVVNDVSGGLADDAMTGVVARSGAPYIAMHWRGHSTDMQSRAVYDDVVADVCAELAERARALVAAGVAAERLVLDPGFGFAKLAHHNWLLLRHLDRVLDLGHPVLVGTSRKTFLGRLGRREGEAPRPPVERDVATAATSVHAARMGAWGVRVHHVPSTLDALRATYAIEHAGDHAIQHATDAGGPL
jgi:dihydropteroate synthase